MATACWLIVTAHVQKKKLVAINFRIRGVTNLNRISIDLMCVPHKNNVTLYSLKASILFNVLEPYFCTLRHTKKSPWVCFSFATHGSCRRMMRYLNRFYCQSACVQMGRNTTSVVRDKIPGNTEGFLTATDENIPAQYLLDGETFLFIKWLESITGVMI